jgi:transcriptional regulator with XRE-family HTH domain
MRRAVGRRIQQLRLQRRLSQERLAESTDRGTKHISQIERGQVNVGLDSLIDIAERLSVAVRDLFPESDRIPVYSIIDQDLRTLEQALDIVTRVRTDRRRASSARSRSVKRRRKR